MTSRFAAKPVMGPSFTISKAHLRAIIWLLALAVVVLLPKPADALEAKAQSRFAATSSLSPSISSAASVRDSEARA